MRSGVAMRSFVAQIVIWVILIVAAPAAGQCEREWLPGLPVSGVGGFAWAVEIAPGGDVVVGGEFDAAGSVKAANIARWDGQAWHALGEGVNGRVRAIAFAPNGDIVVGGRFTHAGGVECNHIARWDGQQWHALGAGMGSPYPSDVVVALHFRPDGDLIAGGLFESAGGATASNVARWDGQAWSAMGPGFNNFVSALEMTPGGDLVAGGNFTASGSQLLRKIGRWDGNGWVSMDPPNLTSGVLRALMVHSSGHLIAAGSFVGGGVALMMRWDGQQWHAMNCPQQVRALAELPGGDIVAVGDSQSSPSVLRWDGQQWSYVGTTGGAPMYDVAATDDDDLIVVGRFGAFYNGPTWFVSWGTAVLRNGTWSRWYGDPTLTADAMLRLPSGDLLITGQFSQVSGIEVNNAALYTAGQWAPFNNLENPRLRRTALGMDGTIFGVTRGSSSNDPYRVLRWRGGFWEEIGLADGGIEELFVDSNGDLIAAGGFLSIGGPSAQLLARWDGTRWQSMGLIGLPGSHIFNVAQLLDGRLAIAPAGAVLVQSGGEWEAIGAAASGQISDLLVVPSGDLIVSGSFESFGGVPAKGVARWDGSQWHAMGLGVSGIYSLAAGPSGTVLAAGYELDPAGNSILVWDGENWTPPEDGSPQGYVAKIMAQPGGDLAAIGTFSIAGEHISANFARMACPPPECYANCDFSTGSPLLNAADFACFLQKFAAGEAYANCDGSPQPPVLNVADFGCFLSKFAAGCP